MPNLDVLTDAQRAFLAALRTGVSGNEYARSNNYSTHWAKWISGEIRARLGVTTIAEAIAMSEVSAEDMAALRKELADLREAQRRLEDAKTPAAKEAAREDVREAKSDLDDELRSRGLSRSDLDRLQEEKEYEKFKGREERLRKEREDAEAKESETADPEKPKRKAKEKVEETVTEEPPESQHWADRKLWGKKDAA